MCIECVNSVCVLLLDGWWCPYMVGGVSGGVVGWWQCALLRAVVSREHHLGPLVCVGVGGVLESCTLCNKTRARNRLRNHIRESGARGERHVLWLVCGTGFGRDALLYARDHLYGVRLLSKRLVKPKKADNAHRCPLSVRCTYCQSASPSASAAEAPVASWSF